MSLHLETTLLLGREAQVQELEDSFAKVQNGDNISQVLWLSGMGGVGKSTLIRKVFADKPHFCAGKFDRFKPAEAFPTIVSLLHDMCETLEASSEDVTGLTGDAVATLMRLYPDLDSVVANENLQQVLDEESPVASENCKLEWSYEKLKQAFVSFVKATTEALDEPLVLFLDDLQWMPPDTLGVVEALLQSLPQGIFFIGSYRDNEIDKYSPLGKLMERQQEENVVEFLDSSGRSDSNPCHVNIKRLHIQNLTLQATTDLIANAVNSSSESREVVVLSEHIFQTTSGNALYTRHMLWHLHRQGMLRFSQNGNKWEFDVDTVDREIRSCDSISDFMVSKLKRVSPSTLNILQIAACMGAQTSVELLERLLETQKNASHVHLKTDPRSDLERMIQEGTEEQLIVYDDERNILLFAHDRIQTAAYSMLGEDQQQALHLMIGTCLQENSDAKGKESHLRAPESSRETIDQKNRQLIMAADQLTRGRKYIEQTGRENLARLNLQAAEVLRQLGAFKTAQNFLEKGVEMLGLRAWDTQYELSLELHSTLASTQHMNGYMEDSMSTVRTIYLYAKTLQDQYSARFTHVEVLTSLNHLDESLALIDRFLQDLGQPRLPKKAGLIHIVPNMIKVGSQLKGKSDEDLLDLPLLTDSDKLATLKLYSLAMMVAFFVEREDLIPFINAHMMLISLGHGYCQHTPNVFATYAFGQTVIGNLEGAAHFKNLALKMMQRDDRMDSATLFTVYGLLDHIDNPIQDTINGTMQAYSFAFGRGDISYAAQAGAMHISSRQFGGTNLNDTIDVAYPFLFQFKKFNQVSIANVLKILLFCMLELADRTSEFDDKVLKGEDGRVDELEASIVAMKSERYLFFHCFHQMMNKFYLGRHSLALKYAKRCWRTKELQGGIFYNCPYFFFSALVALDHWREKPRRRFRYRYISRKYTRKIEDWYAAGNPNCVHLLSLLHAERMVDQGKPAEKIRAKFTESIRIAEQGGFLQDAALANERAAAYLRTKERFGAADQHFFEALRLYDEWGAVAKVRQLSKTTKLSFDTSMTHSVADDHHLTTEQPLTNKPLPEVQEVLVQ